MSSHREHRGHRELLFSVLSVLSVRNRRCRSLDFARDDSEVQIPSSPIC